MATSMAIRVIMKVPANSGTAPKLAVLSTPSPRPAASWKLLPGSQVVPVMKVQKLSIWKKRMASKMMEARMPNVVTMEIIAAPIST